MYILKLLGNIEVKADADELEKITNTKEGLVFLRNGAVNIKHITAIIKDTDRERLVLKRPGDTEESLKLRAENDRSDDIFPQLRRPAHPSFNLEDPFKKK